MKYFLVFTTGDAREDYSVLYSELVIAQDEKEAKEKYEEHRNNPKHPEYMEDDEPVKWGDEDYGIQELEPIK